MLHFPRRLGDQGYGWLHCCRPTLQCGDMCNTSGSHPEPLPVDAVHTSLTQLSPCWQHLVGSVLHPPKPVAITVQLRWGGTQ